MISKRLKDWLKKLDVKSSIELLQKAALLGTKSYRPEGAGCNLLSKKCTKLPTEAR